MNNFDKYLKRKAESEPTEIPDSVKIRIEETLSKLPGQRKTHKKIRVLPRIAAAAACFIFVMLFLLPNLSVAYAKAAQQMPIIGKIVKVITVRNYFYSDDYHEMNIDVPKVSGENGEAADYINRDVNELTDELVKRFYSDLESIGDEGHSSVYVDYETVTNTEKWFTLKIQVHEAAGSSNTYYKYYHINKLTGEIVKLGDLAADDSFYDILEKEIKRQMKRETELDSNKVYWFDESIIGEDYVSVDSEHNFYFTENGDIVIVFDKYEVAPGCMGTPEFTVNRELVKELIKPEYNSLFLSFPVKNNDKKDNP